MSANLQLHSSLAKRYAAFLSDSPTPFHAVANAMARLTAAGFTHITEGEDWEPYIKPGAKLAVTRNDGALAVMMLGTDPVEETGAVIIGSHSDSPTYRLRPVMDKNEYGYSMLHVEGYGGILHPTWFDRDLSVAGRVVLENGDVRLVHIKKPMCIIPNLAPHLSRESDKISPQQHIHPIWFAISPHEAWEPGQHLIPKDSTVSVGEETFVTKAPPTFLQVIADEIGVELTQIVSHELVLTDTQGATVGGYNDQFVFGPRQDNLFHVFATLESLLNQADTTVRHTRIMVANPYEEIGSDTMDGAGGTFLSDTLSRLTGNHASKVRMLSNSVLVSADVAHGINPSYAERHDSKHPCELGRGPVIKTNANQRYVTSAVTDGWLQRCAKLAEISLQYYSNREDLRCGSTIGPITSTRIGIATVDMGAPILAMHSCRETSHKADMAQTIKLFTSCFQTPATFTNYGTRESNLI